MLQMCFDVESDNPYITRSVLEISNRDFPYVTDTKEQSVGSEEPATANQVQESLETESPVSTVTNTKAPSITQRVVKDIVSEDVDESVKKECNSNLIKSVLTIFLKKEVGMHKRAYKWLNITDSIDEEDIAHLESGLRRSFNGKSDDLVCFFRIINSMTDKENLSGFLIEKLIIEAIQLFMELDYKKNIESMYTAKKNIKTFLNNSLDEFYRALYMELSKQFRQFDERRDAGMDAEPDFDLDDSSEGTEILSVIDVQNVHNNAEKLLKLIIYCIESLDAVDRNVSTVHIPLLFHLVIRNKRKVSDELFSAFLDVFLVI